MSIVTASTYYKTFQKWILLNQSFSKCYFQYIFTDSQMLLFIEGITIFLFNKLSILIVPECKILGNKCWTSKEFNFQLFGRIMGYK